VDVVEASGPRAAAKVDVEEVVEASNSSNNSLLRSALNLLKLSGNHSNHSNNSNHNSSRRLLLPLAVLLMARNRPGAVVDVAVDVVEAAELEVDGVEGVPTLLPVRLRMTHTNNSHHHPSSSNSRRSNSSSHMH
jgi:hypothetical protein